MNRKIAILASADPIQKAKMQQLSWLRQNDTDLQIRREAEKQLKAIWKEIETNWLARGEPE